MRNKAGVYDPPRTQEEIVSKVNFAELRRLYNDNKDLKSKLDGQKNDYCLIEWMIKYFESDKLSKDILESYEKLEKTHDRLKETHKQMIETYES